jgi:hypothetical protein
VEPIVVLLLFVAFSVLNAILDRKRKGGAEGEDAQLPEPQEEELRDTTFRPAPQPRQRQVARAEDDGFAGWGAWPEMETAEEAREEEPVLVGWEPEPRRVPPPEPVVREAPRRPVPVPVVVAPPAPSPEVTKVKRAAWATGLDRPAARELEVDREAEHRRFRETVAAEQPEAARRTTPGVLQKLRNRERLREAILLSEVLGHPRALRRWEERFGG